MKRTIYLLVSILATINQLIPLSLSQDLDKEVRDAKKEQELLIRKYPLPPSALELKRSFSFPSKEMEEKDIYLYRPVFIRNDKDWNICVSDQGVNSIFIFSSGGEYIKKIGRPGQGPGDFMGPSEIYFANNGQIAIKEVLNMRFQFFDPDFNLIRTFKLFKGYHSFVVAKSGEIYAIPNLNLNPSTSSKLIEELTANGEIADSFGEPISTKYNPHINNIAQLELDKNDDLYVAFRHYPIIRKYSMKGALIKEIRVTYPLMAEFEKHNLENDVLIDKNRTSKTPSRIGWKPIIDSLIMLENSFLIFISYPRLEFLEFDLDGNKISHYWSDMIIPYLANGALVREKEGKKTFYILQTYPEARVDVYEQR